jgi:hypothetical protein
MVECDRLRHESPVGKAVQVGRAELVEQPRDVGDVACECDLAQICGHVRTAASVQVDVDDLRAVGERGEVWMEDHVRASRPQPGQQHDAIAASLRLDPQPVAADVDVPAGRVPDRRSFES